MSLKTVMRSKRARAEALEGYLWISPWLVGLLVFTAGPIIASLYLSFTKYKIGDIPQWLGLANYKEFKGVAAPVAVAIAYTPFKWLQPLIKLAIIAGFTSVILVMLLGQSRVFFSMSRDGLLPKVFSEIHPRYRTPWRSNLLFMAFVSLFSAFAPISVVGHMTSIGTLFAFIIVCTGIMIMRRTQPDLPRPFRTPWVPLVPVLGILVNFAMMYGLGWENWMRLLVWLIIGLCIYFGYSRRHSNLRTGYGYNPD